MPPFEKAFFGEVRHLEFVGMIETTRRQLAVEANVGLGKAGGHAARKARWGETLQLVQEGFFDLCQILSLAPVYGKGLKIEHPVVLSIERDHDVPLASFRLA